MLGSLGKVVWRRPRTTGAILLLLILAGTGAGLWFHVQHQWRAAQAALKEGRPAEARSRLEICLLVWPRSVPVRLLAARAARLSGDFQEAEAHLNRCLKLKKGATEEIQLEFLLMRVQTGEVDEVAPELMSYVESQHPESALILETIALAYMHNLRYGPALASLNRWMKETPDAAQPYFWRGWVWERMEDSDEAMKDYQQALELDPNHVPARLRLAEMFLDISSPPAALPHLERLRAQFPDRADVMARLGQCRFLQGRNEEARPLLEAAVEKLPNDLPLLVHLAKLELQDNRPVEAEKWARRLLKLDAYDLEAKYVLFDSLRLQGRPEEAAVALKEYETHKALMQRANALLKDEVGRSPSDPSAPSEAGAIFVRMGQERLGLYWLHEALKRDSGHKPTHRALAEYYERKGEREKAAQHRLLSEAGQKAALP